MNWPFLPSFLGFFAVLLSFPRLYDMLEANGWSHTFSSLNKMPLPAMLYIYYGSEMGTGQGFAEDLGEFLTKNGIANTVLDIDEFEEEDIVNQELCIFFFSTYGKGMPTRMVLLSLLDFSYLGSSKPFFAWMKSNCGDSTIMAKVKYAMFGLGDHNYPHYQAASIVRCYAVYVVCIVVLARMGGIDFVACRPAAAEDGSHPHHGVAQGRCCRGH